MDDLTTAEKQAILDGIDAGKMAAIQDFNTPEVERFRDVLETLETRWGMEAR